MNKPKFGTDLKAIGRRIKTVRESLQISQGKMAQKFDVVQSTYGNYEKGNRLTVDFILKFHHVCTQELGGNFSVQWLLLGSLEADEEKLPEIHKTIIADPTQTIALEICKQIDQHLEILRKIEAAIVRMEAGQRQSPDIDSGAPLPKE